MTRPWPGSPDWYGDVVMPEPAPAPWPDVDVTENPVVAELLGPDGSVIAQLLERPPIGFALPLTQGDT